MGAERKEQNWREGFVKFREFLAGHPEIRITKTSLTIPKERREEFYARLEEISRSLAGSLLGDRAVEGAEMAARCRAVREELVTRTGLEEFRLPSALENLIASPFSAFARPIFGLMMDGIQQGLSEEEIEERAARALPPFADDLLRNAYEAWAYYGIIAALKPIRFYGIQSPDTVQVNVVETGAVQVGYQVTSPERRLPEAVLETADGRFFAMKSESAGEIAFYGTKIQRKQDFSSGGNTTDVLTHRVLLLYCLEKRQDAGLLANREKLYIRPADLICEYLLPGEMSGIYPASCFAERMRTIRSRRPVQVLTLDDRGEFPEEIRKDPKLPKWERVVVGYDREKLAEIAGKLSV